MTLSEWLDYYMPECKKRFVKPTTYVTYTVKVENHIKPAIGHYRLKALRQDIIQKFVNGLSDKGLAPATVEAIFKLLHNALETAVDDGLIVKNVANRVRLPKVPKPKIEVLTTDQQTIFVEKAKETYMGNMYVFDLCTGMRLGELLGLKWSDIDFQTQQLHIHRTLSKVKDPDKPDESWHLAFGAPKTPASERTTPLHQTAVKLLMDVLEQQKQDKAKAGAAYEDNDLVFCTKLGRPQDPINMRRTFYRICDKAGISGLHPHCLRHPNVKPKTKSFTTFLKFFKAALYAPTWGVFLLFNILQSIAAMLKSTSPLLAVWMLTSRSRSKYQYCRFLSKSRPSRARSQSSRMSTSPSTASV